MKFGGTIDQCLREYKYKLTFFFTYPEISTVMYLYGPARDNYSNRRFLPIVRNEDLENKRKLIYTDIILTTEIKLPI